MPVFGRTETGGGFTLTSVSQKGSPNSSGDYGVPLAEGAGHSKVADCLCTDITVLALLQTYSPQDYVLSRRGCVSQDVLGQIMGFKTTGHLKPQ